MSWLPKAIKPTRGRDGMPIFESGMPNEVELLRLSPAEKSLHAVAQVHCCDCNLGHVVDYEVGRKGTRWVLTIRSYRIE